MKKISTIDYDGLRSLKRGDIVLLSGEIYTARDAAHKRMFEAANSGIGIPFDFKNKIVYYAGPTPAKPGFAIGSCGPTTSERMDKYTPTLLDKGIIGMIGKGDRSDSVIEAIIRNKAVYFAAIGGAGALISKSVVKSELIAYDDLGTEAIRRLFIREFYVTVAIDSNGDNIYRN